MRKVLREELLDYQTYTDQRDDIRQRVSAVKGPRRVHVGEYLTFLFENHHTIRFQVQEMMRVEKLVRETDIQHELDTYNGLLGEGTQVGCSLLIEIEDKGLRAEKLRAWRDLPEHLYIRLEDGSLSRAVFDAAQMDDEKLSAVQFLKFDLQGQRPLAIGTDLPDLTLEAPLSPEQQQALLDDLIDDTV